MKLNAPAADAFLKKPNLDLIGALLHGPDEGLLAGARKSLVAAIAEGDDLRIARFEASSSRAGFSAELDAALRARGFFPGRRAVVLEGAKDAMARSLAPVLDDLTSEDAFLIVAAQNLTARSALRKLFEGHRRAAAVALWPKAPTAGDAAARLDRAGCAAKLSPEAGEVLAEVLAGMDSGSADRLIDGIALSFLGETGVIDAAEIEPHLPLAADAGVDSLIDAVVDGRPEAVGPALRRVTAGGVAGARIMSLAARRFRDLVAIAGAGEDSPVFGPYQRRLVPAARRWGPKLEEALRLLFAAEGRLRSPGLRPDLAIVERCMLRLAVIGSRVSRR